MAHLFNEESLIPYCLLHYDLCCQIKEIAQIARDFISSVCSKLHIYHSLYMLKMSLGISQANKTIKKMTRTAKQFRSGVWSTV